MKADIAAAAAAVPPSQMSVAVASIREELTEMKLAISDLHLTVA